MIAPSVESGGDLSQFQRFVETVPGEGRRICVYFSNAETLLSVTPSLPELAKEVRPKLD